MGFNGLNGFTMGFNGFTIGFNGFNGFTKKNQGCAGLNGFIYFIFVKPWVFLGFVPGVFSMIGGSENSPEPITRQDL